VSLTSSQSAQRLVFFLDVPLFLHGGIGAIVEGDVTRLYALTPTPPGTRHHGLGLLTIPFCA